MALAKARDGVGSRRVALSHVGQGVVVSTVRLTAAAQLPGVRYETMVFGGPMHGYMNRYETKGEAQDGHEQVVQMVKEQEDADS